MQASRANTSIAAGSNRPKQTNRGSTTISPRLLLKNQSIPYGESKDSSGISIGANTTFSSNSEHSPAVLDDLDLMICHEEFAKLVALANKVKHAQKMQQSSVSAATYYQQNQLDVATSNLAPSEVIAAVHEMQEKLSVKNVVIKRGMYPLTDAMMDDNFSILQQELDLCESAMAKAAQQSRYGASSPELSKQNEPVSVRYAKWQTDILMHWMVDNNDNPFPSQRDIDMLADATGLHHQQIQNWISNVRRRSRKATWNGKKPRHFIDFLFLAQQRDEAKRTPQPNDLRRKETIEQAFHKIPSTPQRTQLSASGSSNERSALVSPFSSAPCYIFGDPKPRVDSSDVIPCTPPSHRLHSPSSNRYSFQTPPACPSFGGTPRSSGTKRRREEAFSDQIVSSSVVCKKSVRSGKNSSGEVTSQVSVDAIEPISIYNVDVDEEIMVNFADNWKTTPSPCDEKNSRASLDSASSSPPVAQPSTLAIIDQEGGGYDVNLDEEIMVNFADDWNKTPSASSTKRSRKSLDTSLPVTQSSSSATFDGNGSEKAKASSPTVVHVLDTFIFDWPDIDPEASTDSQDENQQADKIKVETEDYTERPATISTNETATQEERARSSKLEDSGDCNVKVE